MRGVEQICLFLLLAHHAQGDSEVQLDNGHHHARRSHHTTARLRHLRHLEDRIDTPVAEALRSQPLRTSTNTVNAGDRLTIDDNHKPVFTNCSRYNPSFKEEEPPGTYVFQVQAVDRDPPDAGGTILYSFVLTASEQKKFNIDAETGIITTKHIFDRDEPIREKEVYLTVRATDNGRPQLDDVCTFKVIIQDINDNTPVFDKINYLESVPQDLAPTREVMRISATDVDDGNNSIVHYDIDGYPAFFRIDTKTGVIFLKQPLVQDPGFKFKLNASATDQGDQPNVARINLEILVVESHKKAPTFVFMEPAHMPILLQENRIAYNIPVVNLTATSNIPDEPDLLFVLVTGRTEQTNKHSTFVMESNGTRAYIKQGKALDFETVSEYTLTIRVQNKYNLAAERQILIQLEDVNDNIPAFTEVVSGSVLENEPPGMPVMQVRAIDGDGTALHNQVTYELADNLEYFHIDLITGNITTLKQFDREDKDFYNVKVYARDNSPSAIFHNGQPNKGEQVFRIEIADKNDNPPHFTQEVYVAESIAEDANINALVTEVKALDNDTASPVTYSIMADGNINEAFFIESTTGKIRVNKQLDYEDITSYSLKVRAFDGFYEHFAKVEIKIENVNDNLPVFLPYRNNITIQEEELVPGCIVKLEAYDPDIVDREAEQRIQYFVVKDEQRKLLTIDKTGCLSLIKSLDRDPPNGYSTWQVHIGAKDEDGNSPSSLQATTEVVIILTDINDNAPFLDMPFPVVWYENRPPGIVTMLMAKDYDSDENGPPFTFKIDISADEEIKTSFRIIDASLEARVTFDREAKKVYYIPIAISDSGMPPMTGTSTLTVEIGDENDNAMKPGHSNIYVYNYKGEAPDTEIGRVYVDDPDDWDLADKHFNWASGPHPSFSLDSNTGMITMNQGTSNNSYLLEFTVWEEATKYFSRHSVAATVNVTVKEIPEEAVTKSGSIRFQGISAEEFVAPGPGGGKSKQGILREQLALLLNTSVENVDVFTVLHSPRRNTTLLDVRYSAHGSPYYYPEKLNRITSEHQADLEHELGATMMMINIDECLIENDLCEMNSCSNFLDVQNKPYAVYTNVTSFVGVNAVVAPLCSCKTRDTLVCLNGGTPVGETCECIEGYEGPHCEVLGIGFYGDGWALYPPFQACEESHLSLELTVHKESGLVFYVGPMRKNPNLDIQDFMSLELQEGYPVLMVDYGTGTVKGEVRTMKLNDGKPHRIEIIWSTTGIEMKLDSCQKSDCFLLKTPEGPNLFLNVNGPLQVGGTAIDLKLVGQEMNWAHKPTDEGFFGCIRNLTYNTKTYNLGMPSDSKNVDPGCSRGVARAVSFGIDTNFLVAILVCIAILLILLLAVVVHRRKTDDMYKDMDDIRENIITYEDEGGGEIDAGFDMNVLRMYSGDGEPMLGKAPIKDNLITSGEEVPDICGFLDGKKKVCDNDPETNPFDDVRHYAYEGDGNTTGSLSSLASGTDEGDLNFDYLSNFGPRFRKLADMYGEDPSDEEENFNNPSSESWC